MLTSSESVLLGTTLGAFLTWIFGTTASRQQWRREEQRRRSERRAELYQDMIAAMHRNGRRFEALLVGDDLPGDSGSEDELKETDEWLARVKLFASPQVTDLWFAWESVLIAGLVLIYADVNSPEIADWKRELDSAETNVVQRMVDELDPLANLRRGAPAPVAPPGQSAEAQA